MMNKVAFKTLLRPTLAIVERILTQIGLLLGTIFVLSSLPISMARASCAGLATAEAVITHSEKFPEPRYEMVTGYLRSFEVQKDVGAPIKATIEIDEPLFGTTASSGDRIEVLIPWVDKSAYHQEGLNFFVIVTKRDGPRKISECTSSGDAQRDRTAADILYLRSLPNRL